MWWRGEECGVEVVFFRGVDFPATWWPEIWERRESVLEVDEDEEEEVCLNLFKARRHLKEMDAPSRDSNFEFKVQTSLSSKNSKKNIH